LAAASQHPSTTRLTSGPQIRLQRYFFSSLLGFLSRDNLEHAALLVNNDNALAFGKNFVLPTVDSNDLFQIRL
jgi:hypothetical protein